MGLPVFKNIPQGHAQLGNGMHMPTMTAVMLATFACVDIVQMDPCFSKTGYPVQVPLKLLDELNRLARDMKCAAVPKEFMAYILGPAEVWRKKHNKLNPT